MTSFIVVKPSATYRLGRIISLLKAKNIIRRIYLIEKYSDIHFGQSLSKFSDSNVSTVLYEDDKWGFIIEVSASYRKLNQITIEINKDIFDSLHEDLLCCPVSNSEAKLFTDVVCLQHGFNTCVFSKKRKMIKSA